LDPRAADWATTGQLIELITKAICYKYGSDAFSPSLITSLIRGGKFYISVVRYQKSISDRFVVHKFAHTDLNVALREVARQVSSHKKTENPEVLLAQYLEQDEKKKTPEENDSVYPINLGYRLERDDDDFGTPSW
jgi:hypothetical protein